MTGVPPSGSGHSAEPEPSSTVSAVPASVPNADDVRLLSAGPDSRGGFTFSFADGEQGGVIHIIAAHLAEMMGLNTDHPLNCVQMEIKPANGPWLTLTMQRQDGKTPLRLKAEAKKLLEQTLAAIESGRSEPLFIMRDAIRNWIADDPASAIEARSDATPKSGAAEGESAVAEPDAQPEPSS